MTTTELHALRNAQLKALYQQRPPMTKADHDAMITLMNRAEINFLGDCDTRNLSDKALEEIQTLAGRYLEQVK